MVKLVVSKGWLYNVMSEELNAPRIKFMMLKLPLLTTPITTAQKKTSSAISWEQTASYTSTDDNRRLEGNYIKVHMMKQIICNIHREHRDIHIAVCDIVYVLLQSKSCITALTGNGIIAISIQWVNL